MTAVAIGWCWWWAVSVSGQRHSQKLIPDSCNWIESEWALKTDDSDSSAMRECELAKRASHTRWIYGWTICVRVVAATVNASNKLDQMENMAFLWIYAALNLELLLLSCIVWYTIVYVGVGVRSTFHARISLTTHTILKCTCISFHRMCK